MPISLGRALRLHVNLLESSLSPTINLLFAKMTVNQGNVFSAKSLTEYMLSSLPKDSSPALRDPYDAVALLCHACMIAVGFRLTGLGEEHRIGGCYQPLVHHTRQLIMSRRFLGF